MTKHLMLMALTLLVVGCTKDQVTTAPLSPIVVQEAVIPVAACPKQVDDIVYPTRPALAIDTLSQADKDNYKKVGHAYMQTIADLQSYAAQLEDVAYGVKEICNTVNNNNAGK